MPPSTTGAIRFEGEDLCAKSEREMRGIRGARIGMIFQEPMTALNPLYTVGNQIGEVLELHEGCARMPPARAPSSCWRAPASPSPRSASTSIRTSSRAASASAP